MTPGLMVIGEEFFAASAYLSQRPELIGGVKGQDMIKVIVITLILGGVILRFFHYMGMIDFSILEFLTVR